MIFVTDGSQDKTVEIVSRYPEIKLLHQDERKGKVSAINRAMKEVKTSIVIFSDANSSINPEAIKKIVRHYQDKLVGGVTGEKKVIDPNENHNGVLEEGSYWKYESFLKKMDSSFYSVVGAAGELFSMRTELFEFLPQQIVLEDFVQSLLICRKGYSVKYEPDAVAIETSSLSIKEELKRKIRISAGGFQAMKKLKPLFNVFKYPKVSFQLLSHRILRWTICPICLPFLFITNLFLVNGNTYIYKLFFVFQVLFYLFGALGFLFAYNNIKIRVLSLSYYFVFMNAAVYMGFWKFVQNRQTVLWEKATREDSG
jgi:cellulose synthase/poly-beta-1,6-N-acetylglucosamine synthase-like glycosyltransferase